MTTGVRPPSIGVSEALKQRHAVRAFRPDPVDPRLLRDIIGTAARAPSGSNLQPWNVWALIGAPLAGFKASIAAKFEASELEKPEYQVYPPGLWEPLRSRRRIAGAQRYAALGLPRSEESLRELTRRNYRFFDAPVGLFFSLDRRVGPPQWADVGMFMLAVMLLAVERGLATCPQEIWSNWPQSIAAAIGLPEDQMVFAGMALGYADPNSSLNSFRSEREAFDGFARVIGE